MPRRYLDEFPEYDDEDPDTGAALRERLAYLHRLADMDDRDNVDRTPRPPPPGYRTEIKKMDQGYYWHLYRGERRVNGGLQETWAGAQHAARSAIAAHLYASY